MKLILATIQPGKLQAVRDALKKIEVLRMTVCEAMGFAQQRGHTEMYRGIEYRVDLLPKIQLEIMVNDDFLERTLEALTTVARTGGEGNIGDGKIFVLPALQSIRIDTGKRGPETVS